MTRPGTTHYLNADFDLRLRPRGRRELRAGLQRQVDELSLQAVLGVRDGDAVLLRTAAADDWLGYLERCGLSRPAILRHPAVDPARCLRPFGWSDEAIRLNRLHASPTGHPAAECVRRVNSRLFARNLEAELFPLERPFTSVDDVAALESWLAATRSENGWMLKADHGNAGLGNRRLRGSKLSDADRGFVAERLEEDDHVIVEPWFDRRRDWCMVFDVPFDAGGFRVHETVMTADGALIGAILGATPRAEPSREALADAARRIARRLADEGYFGPVCVDAFEWRDGEQTRLRPLVDLNCRRSMSDGAHRLAGNLLEGRVAYYRFFNRRRLDLPGELAGLLRRLGDEGYDPARRRGILVAAPIDLTKVALVLVGESRDEVLGRERWFRDRFEA